MSAIDAKGAEDTALKSEDEAKAAKRAAILEKVKAAKEAAANQEAQKAAFFGEHPGISCESCCRVNFATERD